MKGYGTRTLEGNWFEERQNLEKYVGRPLRTSEMTIDLHISARDRNPPLEWTDKTVVRSAYTDNTDPARLRERRVIQNEILRRDKRKLLAAGFQGANIPTQTMNFLSTRFYDPHKLRMKTVYMKSYNDPEFEKTMAMRKAQDPPPVKIKNAFQETMDLTWKVD